MRPTLLTLMLPLFLTVTATEQTHSHLVIWGKDGSKVIYALKEKPLIAFDNSNINVSTTDMQTSHPLNAMARFTFVQSEEANLDEIEKNGETTFDGERILFSCLAEDTVISIYDMNGRLLRQKRVLKGDSYTFSLDYLQTGTYIVKANEHTYKIAKR